jgi:heme O synthase-like polyprenyltransferase
MTEDIISNIDPTFVFSALVVATSGAGYVLGSGNIVDIAGLCCTCAGTMMVAASANTLNQVHISYFLTC